MKKLVTAVIFLCSFFCITQSYAQHFLVKGGLTLSNFMSDKETKEGMGGTIKSGFHVGVACDIPIYRFFSFEPGLTFTTKGVNLKLDTQVPNPLGGAGTFSARISGPVNMYYLDLPLNLKFTHKVRPGFAYYGTFGPIVGVGLSGKTETITEVILPEGVTLPSGIELDSTVETDIEWGNEKDGSDHYKRLDAGLTLGVGASFKSLQLRVSYNLGLYNISPTLTGDQYINNRVTQISLGYSI